MKRSAIIFSSGLLISGLSLIFYFIQRRRRKSIKVLENDKDVDTLVLPVIDFDIVFGKEGNTEKYLEECKKVANAFHKYGICLVKDPRVKEEDNTRFIDMLEAYFQGSDGLRDARPEYSYQIGVTPSKVERPRNHCSKIGIS
jgi:hypothetical protein